MLTLQYFGHLTQRADSLEKTLMLGKTEGKRWEEHSRNEMVGWHHWLNGHESAQMPGIVGGGDRVARSVAVHGMEHLDMT